MRTSLHIRRARVRENVGTCKAVTDRAKLFLHTHIRVNKFIWRRCGGDMALVRRDNRPSEIPWRTAVVFCVITIIGCALIIFSFSIDSTSAWREPIRDFGVTVFAVALVTFAFDFVLKRQLLKEMTATLTEEIWEHLRSGVRLRMRKLRNLRLDQLFNAAKHEIRILQTWIGNLIPLSNSIRNAATRNCKVRILILNPDSDQSVYRSKDFGKNDDYARNFINENLIDLNNLIQSSNNIEVCLYDVTPVFSMYAADDLCYLQNYFSKRGLQ